MTVRRRRSPSETLATPRVAPSITFPPAKPHRSFEEVITQIKARIEDGHLARGDKLPAERELATQFQVSRNTLREALRILEISGYVALKRGASGGAFVTASDAVQLGGQLTGALRLTDFSVADLTDAMRAVIGMLMSVAMPTLSKDHLKALENNIRLAEEITDDPHRRSVVLIRFYRLLADATANKILITVADTFVELLDNWVERLGSLDGDKVIRSRRALLKHLRRGDLSAARSELEDHLADLHALWLAGDHNQPSVLPRPKSAARRKPT